VLGHECIALAERKPRCARIMYSRPGEMHSLHVEALTCRGSRGNFSAREARACRNERAGFTQSDVTPKTR